MWFLLTDNVLSIFICYMSFTVCSQLIKVDVCLCPLYKWAKEDSAKMVDSKAVWLTKCFWSRPSNTHFLSPRLCSDFSIGFAVLIGKLYNSIEDGGCPSTKPQSMYVNLVAVFKPGYPTRFVLKQWAITAKSGLYFYLFFWLKEIVCKDHFLFSDECQPS